MIDDFSPIVDTLWQKPKGNWENSAYEKLSNTGINHH